MRKLSKRIQEIVHNIKHINCEKLVNIEEQGLNKYEIDQMGYSLYISRPQKWI